MDPEEVPFVENGSKEPGNKNKGVLDRKSVFLCLVQAVELGYISIDGIPHPKTRAAVEGRIARAGVVLSALMYGRGYYGTGSQQPSTPSFQAREAVTF